MLTDAVWSHIWDQSVRLMPLALLEAAQEVGERGVAPRVAPEVQAQAVAEAVAADVLDQLLEDRRALAVGDAVEDQEGDLGVRGSAEMGCVVGSWSCW